MHDLTRWLRPWVLLAPGGLWVALFLFIPIGLIAGYSIGLFALFPGDAAYSLSGWHTLFGSDSVYLGLFRKSVTVALVVSVLCVVAAFPLAYFLALCSGSRKYLFLLLVLAPFLTSYLLRVLAWTVILGNKGALNSFLYWIGARDPEHPVTALLYSEAAVIIVLVYAWLPFVTLPIFVVLENLNSAHLEAAADLGAPRRTAFLRVTLPLSLPGVVAAFILVFTPTLGEFIVPSLVGGSTGYLYGNAIVDLFGPALDWKTGSVLAVFLFAAAGLCMLALSRLRAFSKVVG